MTSGQVSALFYAPIKERKAWNTRMTLLWTILDVIFEMWGNCQFLRLNLHISLYRLFIAFIQYILSLEWSWNSHCSNRSDNEIPTTAALNCCCPHHVVEWPCGQAGLKQLLCCQEEAAIKGGYSSPIKVMGVLTIPFSGLNLWICGLNLVLIFFLCPLMVDSLHLSLFFLYNFQYVIFFNISKQ